MNDYARELRNNPTTAEARLWQHLRRRQLGGFKFRRQKTIGRYICDFVCLEAALIVELDGRQHVVVWNGTVLAEIDSVLETIYEALHRAEMDGRFD